MFVLWASLPACTTSMPGESFSGPLPPITPEQSALADRLRVHVHILASDIGPRNTDHPEGLARAESYLVAQLSEIGYAPTLQTYTVRGIPCSNIIAELPGSTHPDQIIVVGGHYDSVHDCPAANDNATGTAATIELARDFIGRPQPRTIRFVLFVNEEPPHFWTRDMGSLVYARACKARGESIAAMLSLETMGYYSDSPGSQNYPPPFSLFYPSEGNFIAFVGNHRSRELVKRCTASFRDNVPFPSEGAALPMLVPRVGSSDHWSFWQCGYPALMVTDTAPYRYPHYHKPSDTPDKIDHHRFARVVDGLRAVIADLASTEEPTQISNSSVPGRSWVPRRSAAGLIR